MCHRYSKGIEALGYSHPPGKSRLTFLISDCRPNESLESEDLAVLGCGAASPDVAASLLGEGCTASSREVGSWLLQLSV